MDLQHLTLAVNFLCGKEPKNPEESHDFWQSVDLYCFHIRQLVIGQTNTLDLYDKETKIPEIRSY